MVKFILVDIVPEYHSRDPLFSTFGGTRHIPLYEVLDIFDNKEDALVRLQTKLDTLGWNLKETFEL